MKCSAAHACAVWYSRCASICRLRCVGSAWRAGATTVRCGVRCSHGKTMAMPNATVRSVTPWWRCCRPSRCAAHSTKWALWPLCPRHHRGDPSARGGAVSLTRSPGRWPSGCARGEWKRACSVHLRSDTYAPNRCRRRPRGGGVNVSPAISVAAIVCLCLQACRSSSSMTSSRREPRCANASMSCTHNAIRCSLRWPSPIRRRGHRNDHESLSPCSAICV